MGRTQFRRQLAPFLTLSLLSGCSLIVNDPGVWNGSYGDSGVGPESDGGAPSDATPPPEDGSFDSGGPDASHDGGAGAPDAKNDAVATDAAATDAHAGADAGDATSASSVDGGSEAGGDATADSMTDSTVSDSGSAEGGDSSLPLDSGADDSGGVGKIDSGGGGGEVDSGPPAVCTSGATVCSSNEVITCSATGQWDGGTTSCTTFSQACVDGGCTGSCVPNTHACAPDNSSYEECNAAGEMEPETTCKAPTGGSASCSSGSGCGEGTCPSPDTLCPSEGVNGTCADTQTDTNNCGGCGVVCTGTCALGRCVVTLASGFQNLQLLTLDTQNLYWVDENLGDVYSMPLDGGTVTTLATGQNTPVGIAVDSSYVYWTNFAGSGAMAQALVGGAQTTLQSGLSSNYASYIVADENVVYWYDGPYDGLLDSNSPSHGGGTATTVAPVDGTGGIATTGGWVYWTAPNSGAVLGAASNVGGTSPSPSTVTVATGQPRPSAIAVDTENAYWTTVDGGTVVKAPLAGGGTSTTLASDRSGLTYLTIDGMSVYWSEATAGNIMKAPLSGGGTPTTLFAGGGQPNGIVVDSTYVYWVAGAPGAGAILRTTKE